VTANLETTPAALVALSKKPPADSTDASGDPSTSGNTYDIKPMPLAAAKAITGGFVRVSAHLNSGTTGDALNEFGAATTKGEQKSWLIHGGDGTEIELRSIDGALYARADVGKLLVLGDADAHTKLMVAGAATGIGIPAEYRAAVSAALRGDWVRVDANVTKKNLALLDEIHGGLGAFGFDTNTVERSLFAAVEQKATVTRTSASGSDDHLHATIALADVKGAFGNVLTDAFPGADSTEVSGPSHGSLAVDLTTHDGALSELTLDLADAVTDGDRSFLKGSPFALHMIFDTKTVAISAPETSTPLDPTPLIQQYVDQQKQFLRFLPGGACATPGPNVPKDCGGLFYGGPSDGGGAGCTPGPDEQTCDFSSLYNGDMSCPDKIPAEEQAQFCKDGKLIVPSVIPTAVPDDLPCPPDRPADVKAQFCKNGVFVVPSAAP
jgi:hypothetical protein